MLNQINTLDIIRYVLFAQVFIAFFVAGGIFFKEKNLGSVTLSTLIALVGLHILVFLFGSSELVFSYPQFISWFYYEIAFLFGPLLFIHLKCLIFNKQKLNFTDGLHLLPIVIFWIGYGDVLLMPGLERMQYINTNFDSRTMVWNYVLAFQMAVYAISCSILLFLKKYMLSLKQQQYTIFMLIAYIFSVVLILYLTHYANGWRDFALYYLILTLFIFGIVYILFKDPEFLKQIRKKYFNSNLDKKHMQKIEKKIKSAFEIEQIFLDQSLSVSALAKRLNEKSYHISQTFSECIKENFNDYVNKHRIDIAKQLLHNPDYKQYKIEAIALECGFNNKVTFYKAFTKFTNETPSKFRKLLV